MTERPIRFGTDGWRGVIADDFTFDRVRRVAAAIAAHLRAAGAGRPPVVVVGHDTRFLGRRFAEAVAEVLAQSGAAVHLAATFVPTPGVSYATVALGADAGIAITASHNPPIYSGVKLKNRSGGAASPEMTDAVQAWIDRPPSPDPRPPTPDPGVKEFDAKGLYLKRLAELADLEAIGRARLSVVIDAMHGATQGFLAAVLRERGLPVEEIRGSLNPGFGGGNPEPMPQHLGPLFSHLAARARAGRPAVGLAFDGDGDRIAAADEAGRYVNPHQVFALLLLHLVRHRGQRGAVAKNFATTQMVDLLAEREQLPLHITPIGFKHIAALMERGGLILGGEESGGIGIQGHIPERDGQLCGLLLLELMARTGRTLAELVAGLDAELGPHRYGRVDLPLGQPVERGPFEARLRAEWPGAWEGIAFIDAQDLDGVKFFCRGGGWLLLRPSGTEPVLRVYAEAPSDEAVASLLRLGRRMAGTATT
jgi:phosphomannomutase